MKLRILIIVIFLLAVSSLLTLVLIVDGGSTTEEFIPAEWNEFSETELEEAVRAVFESGYLPEGREVHFISWLLGDHTEKGVAWIREYSDQVSGMEWHLSNTAYQMIKANNPEMSVGLIRLAQELYPNHPDVLGVSGIVAYLSNQLDQARRYFEEADIWKANKPIVNFYFGGLLIISDTMADRTRGKTILIKLVNGDDAELKELAGLALLTSTTVPMTREDIEFFYNELNEISVFREGNPNLSAQALRLIVNRIGGSMPDEGLEIGGLILLYPGATLEDYLGIIKLAQFQGSKELSRKYIDLLNEDASLSSGIEDNRAFKRIKATQHFFEEELEEGLLLIDQLAGAPDADVAALQETFQAIQSSSPSIDTERKLLNSYLKLDIHNPATSLAVLNRLVEIQPLRQKDWIQYALDKLFEMNPSIVSEWLILNGASDLLVEKIGTDLENVGTLKATALINAYLKKEDPESAQNVLTQKWNELAPAVAYFLQARIHSQQGTKEKAVAAWEESHQLTVGTNQFALLKNLGFLALDMDQSVSGMQCLYTSLTAGIPFSREQAITLLQLTLSYGSLRQSIRTAEYLATIEPLEPLHKNNLAYFQFLAEEQVEESVEVMRELVEEYPEINQYRLTLALGLVKAGRINEADRLLQNTLVDWNNTSPRGLLIYVVVLAETDQRTLAQGLMQNLERDNLIPEERALLEGI